MSPQAGFVLQDQVVPRLRSAIPTAVHFVGCEDPEELVQDSIAMAAKMMHNVELAGKKVTSGNIAYYTIQHAKFGRRSVGHSESDAHGSATQLNGKSRLESMEQVVAVDEITGGELLLHDVLSNDADDPSMAVARKMDWEEFCAGLSERDLAVISCIIEGNSIASLSRSHGFNRPTLMYRKQRLAKAIAEFMGPDILIEIQRRPNWRNDLTATKEKMACKDERCH